jgi:hypothetical protein
LKEPWLLLRADTLVIFFGGLAIGTWWLWRAQRRPPPVVVRGDGLDKSAAPAPARRAALEAAHSPAPIAP